MKHWPLSRVGRGGALQLGLSGLFSNISRCLWRGTISNELNDTLSCRAEQDEGEIATEAKVKFFLPVWIPLHFAKWDLGRSNRSI